MFETVMYLLSRLLMNSERARTLKTLRHRFARSLEDIQVDAELERLAHVLLGLRVELSRSIGPVSSCAGCVQPRSDEWPGGHCCSGSTQAIFAHEELAALRLTGAKLSLRAACHEPLLGCVFRGRAGCTLNAQSRPCLCVRYTCRELEAELAKRGDRSTIVELQKQLRVAFEEFCRALHERERDDSP